MIHYEVNYYHHTEQNKSLLIIPKTGTTSIKKVMSNDTSFKEPIGEIFTVIRNPFTRVWSAYQECLRRGTFRGTFSEMLTKIELEGHSFDEHTVPQAMYLDKCPYDIDRWFSFEDRDKINRYLGCILPKLNVSVDKYNQDVVLKHYDRIYAIYIEDFHIWNTL